MTEVEVRDHTPEHYQWNTKVEEPFKKWCFDTKDKRCDPGLTCPREHKKVCFDQSGGALNKEGYGCDWYIGREDMCGSVDTVHFKAKEMCCSCQGGYPLNPNSCKDTDGDKKDLGGD